MKRTLCAFHYYLCACTTLVLYYHATTSQDLYVDAEFLFKLIPIYLSIYLCENMPIKAWYHCCIYGLGPLQKLITPNSLSFTSSSVTAAAIIHLTSFLAGTIAQNRSTSSHFCVGNFQTCSECSGQNPFQVSGTKSRGRR